MARRSRSKFSASFTPDVSSPEGRKRLALGVILLLATLWLAFASVRAVMAAIQRNQNAAQALTFDPDEPRALTDSAAILVSEGKTGAARRQLRRAISAQAVLPKAFGVLAAIDYEGGDTAKGEKLMHFSRRLSRRDEVTNKLFVRASADKGDIEALLNAYDIALRTNTSMTTELTERMAMALDVPEFEPFFIDIVRKRPPWLGQVAMTAVVNTKNPGQVAKVLMTAGPLPDPETRRSVQAALLPKLAEFRQWGMMQSYFQSIKGADPKLLTSTAFSPASTDMKWYPIGWSNPANPQVEAVFLKKPRGTGLSLKGVAYSGTRGVMATKTVFLKPGRYQLAVTSSAFDKANNAQAWAEVFCQTSKGSSRISTFLLQDGVRMGDIVIGSDCPAQTIHLGLAGGDSLDGSEILIEDVKLLPA
jgi:hypothetical protein